MIQLFLKVKINFKLENIYIKLIVSIFFFQFLIYCILTHKFYSETQVLQGNLHDCFLEILNKDLFKKYLEVPYEYLDILKRFNCYFYCQIEKNHLYHL